jgi:hypothetical protein
MEPPMSKPAAALTAKQLQALRIVADGKITGHPVRYSWRFADGDQVYTSAIKALAANGYVTITYYRGYAGVDLTDSGRSFPRIFGCAVHPFCRGRRSF